MPFRSNTLASAAVAAVLGLLLAAAAAAASGGQMAAIPAPPGPFRRLDEHVSPFRATLVVGHGSGDCPTRGCPTRPCPHPEAACPTMVNAGSSKVASSFLTLPFHGGDDDDDDDDESFLWRATDQRASNDVVLHGELDEIEVSGAISVRRIVLAVACSCWLHFFSSYLILRCYVFASGLIFVCASYVNSWTSR